MVEENTLRSQENVKFDVIQYLRFTAAALVVVDHCFAMFAAVGRGDLGNNMEVCGVGVDIFFVISGFLMVVITDGGGGSPFGFIARRFTRIAPTYWLFTILMTAVLFVVPALVNSQRPSLAAFAASLLFFAWPSHTMPGAAPILILGWTLNFEFFFYILFAASMSISHRLRSLIASLVLLSLVSIGILLRPTNVIAQFYTCAIMLDFIAGMVIAALHLNGRTPRSWVSAVCIAIGIIMLAYFARRWGLMPYGSNVVGRHLSPWRPLLWGIPATLIVLGGVGIQTNGRIGNYRLIRTLGDASYSTYLTHPFTLGIFRYIWGHYHLGRYLSDMIPLLLGFVSSLVVGYVIYRYVERPLVIFAQKFAGRPSLKVRT